jgi:hypothetical protein
MSVILCFGEAGVQEKEVNKTNSMINWIRLSANIIIINKGFGLGSWLVLFHRLTNEETYKE